MTERVDRVPAESETPDSITPPGRILAAALDAFSEVGFHGTTVREIADRAGVTVPTLYYHHRNKEAILAALLDHSIDEVIRRCTAGLDRSGPTARARFENLISCLVLFMCENRKGAAMDAEIRALGTVTRREYTAKRAIVEKMLVDTIQLGIDDGEFELDEPGETARALLGMCQTIAVWYRPSGRVGPGELARRYQQIALRTVLPAHKSRT